jgi:hypothetical protein
MELRASTANPSNFGNPAWPGDVEPPSHHDPVAPAVDLRRVLVGEREEFELRRRISYDARIGDRRVTVVVPQADGRFTTDLTSVPRWFTWLVPKSGAHLPAALIHDGLVHDGDPRTYETSDGLPVDRIDADRVFRDAMRDTHVGVVRRWLVWSAVSLTSLVLGPRPVARWPRWRVCYHRALALVLLGVILYLGAGATAELVDRSVRGLPDLPWMVEGRWWAELATGLSGAVAVPVALSALWGRYWAAAAIAGVALATLVHATIAVALVAVGYQLAEAVTDGPRRAPWVVGGALLAAVAVFAAALLWAG